uniref:Uncharacterized protein n=1 Tax=Setaria viridis TaxID=4556 RepID=A0A4U6U4S8_SETVI|nr:hypothetical protein SEVIR_6G074632v2 [Setaria viridis]
MGLTNLGISLVLCRMESITMCRCCQFIISQCPM